MVCLPIFIRVTSLEPGQLYDCRSAMEVSPNDMGKIDYYLTAAWHNKSLIKFVGFTVC